MKAVRVAALALVCASSAVAQERSPTSGIPLPSGSFALTDDATALARNPAGLGFARGVLLEYANERGYRDGLPRGDGAYLSLGGWGGAGSVPGTWARWPGRCAGSPWATPPST